MSEVKAGATPKILVLHNILWSHYKAVVFSKLYELSRTSGLDIQVIHYAETEGKRTEVPERTRSLHEYPFEVIQKGSLENIGTLKLTMSVLVQIWKLRPNLIVLPGYSEFASWCAALAIKILRSKVIIAIDSTWHDKKRSAFDEWVKRILVSRCDGAFVYGTRAGEYAKRLGLTKDRIFTRCQATDNDFYSASVLRLRHQRDSIKTTLQVPFQNVVLYLGRFAHEKNLIYFLRAFSIIRQQHSDASDGWGVVLAGHGPDGEIIRSRAVELALPLVVLDAMPWWETPTLYAIADILVLPSTSEPWGLVINEAMSSHVSVAASSTCGATPDLIEDGVTGVVFDPNNLEEMAASIFKLIESADLREHVATQAFKKIQDYSPTSAAASMLHGFQKVLS